MATAQRVFDTLDTSTFLDGGSAANVNDTGTDSENIDISQWEGTHCVVEADFLGVTDDLIIDVLATADGINYDTIPLYSFTITSNTGGVSKASFFVTSAYNYKVNFRSSGTSDTVNVLFRYRRWRWETV